MRIPSGSTDRYIYFVAVDATDLKSRETGLSSFTVYRSRNGGASAVMTTPTVNETDATNMAGVYELLLDEDTTLTAGNDTEEMAFHITASGMAPVTRVVEIYRPETTEGNTLGVESDGDATKVNTLHGHTAQTGDNYAVLATGIAAETRNNTLIERLKQIETLVEHQRGAHTHQPIGEVFYVDPTNGDTHANGNRGGITDPYLTIQDCHDNAVTDSNHDTIILLSGASGGPTTHTTAATTTISKRYTFIRGPGRDFIVTRTGNGDTLAVTADGVEFSGFQIGTAATGTGNGIQATDADFLRVSKCWINNTQGDGINLLRCENAQIVCNVFTDTGQGGSGEGIHIRGTAGSSNRNHLVENIFHACAGDGVLIEDGTTNQTYIHDNLFESCTGYGVNIGASSTDAVLTHNAYANNSSGEVNDGGTTTVRVNDQNVWTSTSRTLTAATNITSDGSAITMSASGVVSTVNTVNTVTTLTNLPAATTDWLTADALASDAVDEISDQVWDEASSGHVGAGTMGLLLADAESSASSALTAVVVNTNHLTDIKGATWSGTTDSLEAIRDRGDAAWITAVGFSTHAAADVWAVGTRALTDKAGFTISGTLTTLDALGTAQDTQHSATQSAIAALNDVSVADVLTTQMTESYNADGVAPTLTQALMVIMQGITEFANSGTTKTVKKLDGTTTAYTETYDDGTNPTSVTRAT